MNAPVPPMSPVDTGQTRTAPTGPSESQFERVTAFGSIVGVVGSLLTGGLLLPLLGQEPKAVIALGSMSMVFMLVGLVLGLMSIIATFRGGNDKRVWLALLGTALNAALVASVIASIPKTQAELRQRQLARERQGEAEAVADGNERGNREPGRYRASRERSDEPRVRAADISISGHPPLVEPTSPK